MHTYVLSQQCKGIINLGDVLKLRNALGLDMLQTLGNCAVFAFQK
jgi:hypothetical protein